MKENYKILGLDENSTIEEVEARYQSLKAQYQKDRFLEGEAGNEAAKNLTKLEIAYNEIIQDRKYKAEEEKLDLSSVDALIKDGKLDAAQDALDNIFDRNAEWHYLQSVLFYKKNWTNESKKQLEIALELDPSNRKYRDSYEKLIQKINYNERQFRSGNTSYGNQNVDNTSNRQMGGSACGSMADCCATYLCINCLCNSCR